jgi:hypothetical protein
MTTPIATYPLRDPATLERFFRALSGGEVDTLRGHTLYRLAAFRYVVTRVEQGDSVAYVLSDVDGPLVQVGALVARGAEVVVIAGDVDGETREALAKFVEEAVLPSIGGQDGNTTQTN